MKSLLLMSYGKNLRRFASPNLMMSEQDLMCSQALYNVKDQLLNGTMQYKHKLH